MRGSNKTASGWEKVKLWRFSEHTQQLNAFKSDVLHSYMSRETSIWYRYIFCMNVWCMLESRKSLEVKRKSCCKDPRKETLGLTLHFVAVMRTSLWTTQNDIFEDSQPAGNSLHWPPTRRGLRVDGMVSLSLTVYIQLLSVSIHTLATVFTSFIPPGSSVIPSNLIKTCEGIHSTK